MLSKTEFNRSVNYVLDKHRGDNIRLNLNPKIRWWGIYVVNDIEHGSEEWISKSKESGVIFPKYFTGSNGKKMGMHFSSNMDLSHIKGFVSTRIENF